MKSRQCREREMYRYEFAEWNGTNFEEIEHLLRNDPNCKVVLRNGELYIKKYYLSSENIGAVFVTRDGVLGPMFHRLCDFEDRFEIIEEGEGK